MRSPSKGNTMALPPLVKQLVEAKLDKYCDQKVPAHIRDKLTIIYKIKGNKVTLYESRPFFKNPKKRTETPVAMFRYDPKEALWILYCADRNSKWHIYDHMEPSQNLDDLLAAVDEDVTGIFWG